MHREMLRSPKFLSRVSLPLPYGHPNPSFQLLFRPSLSRVHSVLSVVMLRDCCYQRSDGNRQSIDAGRMSCSGWILYTFYFVTGREGKMMALSQHPVWLILIFTKKRKRPYGRVSRLCNVHRYARANEVRKEKIWVFYTLLYLST